MRIFGREGAVNVDKDGHVDKQVDAGVAVHVDKAVSPVTLILLM